MKKILLTTLPVLALGVMSTQAAVTYTLYANNPGSQEWATSNILVDTTSGAPLTSVAGTRSGIKNHKLLSWQTLSFAQDATITDLWLTVSGGTLNEQLYVYLDEGLVAGSDFTIDSVPVDDDTAPSTVHLSGLNMTITAGSHSIGFGDADLDASGDGSTAFGWHYSTTSMYADGDAYFKEVLNPGDFAIAVVGTVPEPSSTALLGLGGLALILRRRK